MEGGQSRSVAPSYLGWSIFNTLCCCLPLGIAAIVCSCRAQNANAVGESAIAADASRTAKILNVMGLVCGIILIIIFIALKATNLQWTSALKVPDFAGSYVGVWAKPLFLWTFPLPPTGVLNGNRCLLWCTQHNTAHMCSFYTPLCRPKKCRNKALLWR